MRRTPQEDEGTRGKRRFGGGRRGHFVMEAFPHKKGGLTQTRALECEAPDFDLSVAHSSTQKRTHKLTRSNTQRPCSSFCSHSS